MKASRKRLKAVLALGVKKFGPASVASKLGEFLFFDEFLDLADFLLFDFPDLDNFLDLDNFPVFDNFLYFLINSPPLSMPPTSSAISISLAASTYNDTVVFSIDVSSVAILLKPWMNCW